MSGIYEGPGGELLYGDGREVEPEPLSPSPETEAYSINCAHCPHVEQWHTSGVIEGTTRGCLQCDECPGFEHPEPQAPEIRYQLHNWHHVTCLVAGGACTCLAQREALIAELAKEKL